MQNQPSDPSFSRIGLLIVDDERAIVKMLEMGLELQGFTVWSATNAQEALDLFRQHAGDIQLALLDVQMPGLDGPALLGELRRLNSGLTCCFMSGLTDPYTEADLLDRGAVRVFLKPFSVIELAGFLRQVRGYMERRESLRLAVPATRVSIGTQQAQLRDRSEGGLGLWSDEPLAVGSVNRLQFEGAEDGECSVEVRHCRPGDAGWLIGCRLVG